LSIEIRRLEASQYDVLPNIADGYCPEPAKSIVVIAANESKIIGRIMLLTPAHIEAIFIEPAWRNGIVMNMLVDAIELEARAEGIVKVLAYAADSQMENYIERFGYKKLPLTVWEKNLCQ
jgi:N-acetylglutamate synthase-like GNAT family acetyltransferase